MKKKICYYAVGSHAKHKNYGYNDIFMDTNIFPSYGAKIKKKLFTTLHEFIAVKYYFKYFQNALPLGVL